MMGKSNFKNGKLAVFEDNDSENSNKTNEIKKDNLKNNEHKNTDKLLKKKRDAFGIKDKAYDLIKWLGIDSSLKIALFIIIWLVVILVQIFAGCLLYSSGKFMINFIHGNNKITEGIEIIAIGIISLIALIVPFIVFCKIYGERITEKIKNLKEKFKSSLLFEMFKQK